MKDLRKVNQAKYGKSLDVSYPAEVASPGVPLPSISFRADELPELSTWKVGQEYTLKVRVQMTEYRERKTLTLEEKEEESRGQFDVIGVEVSKK